MADDDPHDPESDCFKPPAVPVEVFCLHCHEEYESYLIEWRIETDQEGKKHGFWCCPTPGCDGKGFGFDILPTDPEYSDENGGWVHDDDGEEGEFDDEAEDEFIPEDAAEDEDDEEWTPEKADAIMEEAMKDFPRFDAEKELTDILKDIDDSAEPDEEEETDRR